MKNSSEWISIKRLLPQKEKVVLVLVEGNTSQYNIASLAREGEVFLFTSIDGMKYPLPGIITHWLEIPELPK